VLHHDDLIPFGVVRVQFERVIEERPLFLIEDLLVEFDLSQILFFFLLFLLIIFFLLFLISIDHISQDQRLDDASVHNILVAVVVIVEFRLSFFEFSLLSSPEVEYYLDHSSFFFSYLSDLVVEQYVVVFQTVNGFEMNTHAVPSDLLKFF
jgi:hypothetical protein